MEKSDGTEERGSEGAGKKGKRTGKAASLSARGQTAANAIRKEKINV